MVADVLVGTTLMQSLADARALLGASHWISRRGRNVKLELDGDNLDLSQLSAADQEQLAQVFLKSFGAPDRELTTPPVGAEPPGNPLASTAVEKTGTAKGLTVIEGEPARLVIRLAVTAVVLAIAVVAIVAKTSAEPAWGAIGAVVGYWLR